MNPSYKGEDSGLARRAERRKGLALQKHTDNRNRKEMVVRRFDKQELRDETLTTDAAGWIVDKCGTPVSENEMTYMPDSETDDLRGATDLWQLRDVTTGKDDANDVAAGNKASRRRTHDPRARVRPKYLHARERLCPQGQ